MKLNLLILFTTFLSAYGNPGPNVDHIVTSEKGNYILKVYKDRSPCSYLYKLEGDEYNLIQTYEQYYAPYGLYISDDYEIIIQLYRDGAMEILNHKMERIKVFTLEDIFPKNPSYKHGLHSERIDTPLRVYFNKDKFYVVPRNTRHNYNLNLGTTMIDCTKLTVDHKEIVYDFSKQRTLLFYKILTVLLIISSAILGLILYKKRQV